MSSNVWMKSPQTRFLDFHPNCGWIFGELKIHKSEDALYIIWYNMMNLINEYQLTVFLETTLFFRWIFNLYANVYSVDSSTSNIPKKFILIKFWIFSRRTPWFIACKHLGVIPDRSDSPHLLTVNKLEAPERPFLNITTLEM